MTGSGGLAGWIGKTRSEDDLLIPGPARRLAATLDRDPDALSEGADLPPLFHWLYFLGETQVRHLARDGNPAEGGFPPPQPGSRVMWAGGRVQFHRPLILGLPAQRTSTVATVEEKLGSSGPLTIVTLRFSVAQAGEIAVSEEVDVVYRPGAGTDETERAPRHGRTEPAVPDTMRTIVFDPVMLFRYSALTFNSHRIHYDRPYVRTVEGYPGLLVQGPLTATLLAQLAGEVAPRRKLLRFAYRAMAPLYDGQPVDLCASAADGGLALWAQDHAGVVAMSAEAAFKDA